MSHPSTHPFCFVPIPPERIQEKPRSSGRTMMMDWGIPLHAQADLLGLVAPYVDLVKLVVGTVRLYEDSYLADKLNLYDQHDVSPFLGGQFLEFIYSRDGLDSIPHFCQEAKRLGIKAVEVSDNVVPLSAQERRQLISGIIESGLQVHGEVGSKTTKSSAESLIDQARICFDAGADTVLVEAAELLHDGVLNDHLLHQIQKEFEPKRIMFELPGPWIRGTHATDVYAMKVFLVDTFGPNVNLANVMPDDIWETETLRLGLSVPGPSRLRT